MKVLHLTYRIKKGELLSDYLIKLIENEKALSVKVEIATTKKEFSKMLLTFQSGYSSYSYVWNWHTSVCVHKHYSLVVHYFFALWRIIAFNNEVRRPIRKKNSLNSYQRRIIQKSDAVLALSQQEENDIIQLGWNKRTDIVPSCLLNSSVSADVMAANIIQLYTKIIDTRYRRYMDKTEWQCLCALLHSGLQQDSSNKIIPSDCILILRKLTPQQWRRIFICANDEFVRTYVDFGIERLQLVVPNINTAKILRYDPYMPKSENGLDNIKIDTNNIFTKSRYENVLNEEEDTIKRIVTMVANAKELLKQKKFSLLHLSQLYCIIRFKDYDEDHLMIVLRRMHLLKFARRIIYILAKLFIFGRRIYSFCTTKR